MSKTIKQNGAWNQKEYDDRVHACVYACEGISTEALEAGVVKELLDALEQCRADLESVHSMFGDANHARQHCKGLVMADAAIAKAKGE